MICVHITKFLDKTLMQCKTTITKLEEDENIYIMMQFLYKVNRFSTKFGYIFVTKLLVVLTVLRIRYDNKSNYLISMVILKF